MPTPEKENQIRRAAQADVIRGAEAYFRSKPKPSTDVGMAVKRAVTGAVGQMKASGSWYQQNAKLHPEQFNQMPLTKRLEIAKQRQTGQNPSVVKRSKIHNPPKQHRKAEQYERPKFPL